MKSDRCDRPTPRWWPENESWPGPHRGYRMDARRRARFFRFAAMVVGCLVLLALSGLFTLAWIIGTRFELAPWAAPLAIMLALFVATGLLRLTFGGMRRFARPLNDVMDAADRVAGGDYSTRVRAYGPPPMQALAHSFNTMTQRLQDADRLRRDLMADVAHELRTPLSVLQGRLEGLIDGLYPSDDAQLAQLLEETHVLARLIEDLRTLALSEAGVLALQKEPTDLAALASDVVRSFGSEADAKSLSLRIAGTESPAVLDVDPVRIREVLTNLLSNALRHTPPHGTVDVSIAEAHGGISLAVADNGEGMPPEDVARIFDRFYKGPRSRGSGLGLTIAKGIVTAHGGEISAASQLGRGTTVTIALPRAYPEGGQS